MSFLGACGGSKPPGASPFPGKITLTPATSTSLQLGNILTFVATASNAGGTSVSATFTYQSSNTSILNFAPNGVACAGLWDAAFVNCTPGNYGLVQATASALGSTSEPTLVYVHPAIDNIQISLVPPVNSPPPACPGQKNIPFACIMPPALTAAQQCLSANQTMTLQANAYSRGADITASVGPFTWSETNSTVVTVTPTVTNTSTNIPTNQVTVTPGAPGFTPVFATASGVASQPYYAETCPVQCVALALGNLGSEQTSFVSNKTTSQTAVATAVDVQGCVVPKPPLTWSSSQPGAVLAGSSATGCAAGTTCTIGTQSPGSGSVTAACTPPTCNIGYPQSVSGLPLASGQKQLVQPLPVYPSMAISGLVTGATSSTTVLATSLDCATNLFCNANAYDVSTSTNAPGGASQFPNQPNSLLYDLAGDKVYVGSNFGAMTLNPANLGTNGAFTALSGITGNVLAISANGSLAIFANNTLTPNQVYVANTTSSTSAVTTLNISGAIAAAFSPDGLKAFIIGCSTPNAPLCNGNPGSTSGDTLYIYSPVQALQTIPLSAAASGVTFSANGAFAFVTGGSTTSTVSVYNTCDNSSVPLTITLPAAPLFLQDLPPGDPPPPVINANLIPACDPNTPHSATNCAGLEVLIGLDNSGLDLIATNTFQPVAAPACPLSMVVPAGFVPQHIDLGQGTFHPINFFMSPDATSAYIVASDRSQILVYDFATNSTNNSIPLANNKVTGQSVTPVTASMTVDGTLIYVAGSDGALHEVSTALGVDQLQIAFPNLPDVTNAFCSSGGTTVACNLNVVAVKP